MTITRVFGVRNAAGSRVEERRQPARLVPGEIGTIALAGIFPSGPVGEAQSCDNERYRRIYGARANRVQSHYSALSTEHVYDQSNGRATVIASRITDGSEVQAQAVVLDRNVWRSVLERADQSDPQKTVGTIKAHNGGKWGGSSRRAGGNITLSTAIVGLTVDLGITTLTDRWVGATLTFPNDDASYSGKITANTAAGVFTVAGPFPDSILNGTNGLFLLVLGDRNELFEVDENVQVLIGDDPATPTTFTLDVYRDARHVKQWPALRVDPSDPERWDAVLNDEDADNWELAITDSYAGDPASALSLPANWAGIPQPQGTTGGKLYLQVTKWTRTSAGGGTAYLDTVNDLTMGATQIECTITCTFTAPTTFNASVTSPLLNDSISLATGVALGAAITSPISWFPNFTLRAGGSAMASGDTLVITIRALPENLQDYGAMFYPAAGPSEGDVNTRYRIIANGPDWVQFANGIDSSTFTTPPAVASHEGTVAETYDLSSGTNTVIFTVNGDGAHTLTSSLSGAATTATALVDDLNAQELARVSAVAADKLVEFYVADSDKVGIRLLQDWGGDASLVIGAGGLNARLGFTAATYTGTDAKIARISWRQALVGGYDGSAGVGSTHYRAAWDTDTSPFNEFLDENTGAMLCAMPGTTDKDAQQDMMRWAFTNNCAAFPMVPSNITTEAGAIAWYEANLAIGDAQGYAPMFWPAHGSVFYAGKLVTGHPIIGAILGEMARIAVEAEGYHEASAGTKTSLSTIVKGLITGKRKLDNEVLNGRGFTEVRRRGAQIMLWGNRIPTSTGYDWRTSRLTLSQIGRTLLTNTTQLVFERVTDPNLAKAASLVRQLARTWFDTGWFDDSDGPAFEDQVQVVANSTNNPASSRAAGQMRVDISVRPAGVAERVTFGITERQITEG